MTQPEASNRQDQDSAEQEAPRRASSPVPRAAAPRETETPAGPPLRAQHYTEEQVRAILRQAVDLSGGEEIFSQRQLLEMADELGISREVLAAAESKWRENQADIEEHRAFQQERRQGFRQHLAIFIMVNIFLLLLNIVTSPEIWWFIFPLLGWGLGLAMHGWTLSQNSGESYEREFEVWQNRRGARKRFSPPPR